MPENASSLLEKAQACRERADRARRLAAATTAPDVTEGLRSYATRLDEEARYLTLAAANAKAAELQMSRSRDVIISTTKPSEDNPTK
jgi:hypothetical protein